MLIAADSRPEGLRETGLRWWRGARFVIGWKGHAYLPGLRAGAASMAALAERLAERPLAAVIGELRGVFGLFVHDRRRPGWQIAVDNTGLYKVFHDRQGAGTGLLELLRARRPEAVEIVPEALVGFLLHGFVAAPDTFVRGVAKLTHDRVLELRPGAAPLLVAKELSFPDSDDEATVLRHFAELATSLAGRRLSVDVTGGFDSRLVACLLASHGLDFEVAITGQPGGADVALAARAAATLGRPFHPWHHDTGRLEQEIAPVFAAGDGQHELRGFHRDWQNARARLRRGVEVMAHGGGGEVFKDWNSVQDFPFYGRRRANLERFYALRLVQLRFPPELLGEAGRRWAAAAKATLLERCAALQGATNSQTYDRIYVLLRLGEFAGRYYTNYINLGLDVVAPFLELRAARVAWRMSPWRRWMNGWHRRVISAHCPALAALPTTDGLKATSGLASLPGVLGNFVAQGLRRVARKAGQRLLGRTLFEKQGALECNAPDYLVRLRGSPPFAAACAALTRTGILAPGQEPARIPDFFVPRVVTLGLFLEAVEGAPAARLRPSAAA